MFSASAIIFITCRNRHHMKSNIRYKANINNTTAIIFLIGNLVFSPSLLCDLTKLPAMVLASENLQEVFVMLVVVFLTGIFYISGLTFPCHRHSILASQAREGLHQL